MKKATKAEKEAWPDGKDFRASSNSSSFAEKFYKNERLEIVHK